VPELFSLEVATVLGWLSFAVGDEQEAFHGTSFLSVRPAIDRNANMMREKLCSSAKYQAWKPTRVGFALSCLEASSRLAFRKPSQFSRVALLAPGSDIAR
jgi:hypothetical protein